MFTGFDELTIIIPTVSRPKFVLRQHKYWGMSDANVVILDGANEPIEIPESLRHKNVRYIHTGTRFNDRLATAGKLITTRYAALLCDDEFFAFGGLRAAIDRLNRDPQVIGCVGRSLFFFVDQGRFLLAHAYRDWKPFSPAAQTLHSRLQEDLPPNKTHKAQFAVMRTPEWISIFENSYRQFFSSGYTYERLINLQRTILGRTEILDDLFWFRSMENPPISSENVPRTGKGEFVRWARSPEYQEEVKFYRATARQLLIDGGVAPQDVKVFEERFFLGGVERQEAKQQRLVRRFNRRFRSFVFAWSPRKFRLFAKRYFSNRLLRIFGWQGFTIGEMYHSLNGLGTRFVEREIEIIGRLSLETAAELQLEREKQHDQ